MFWGIFLGLVKAGTIVVSVKGQDGNLWVDQCCYLQDDILEIWCCTRGISVMQILEAGAQVELFKFILLALKKICPRLLQFQDKSHSNVTLEVRAEKEIEGLRACRRAGVSYPTFDLFSPVPIIVSTCWRSFSEGTGFISQTNDFHTLPTDA